MLRGITRQRFGSGDATGVRTLTPGDIGKLSLEDHPRLNDGDAEALVIQAPGLSKWHPETGEFLIVTPWRHRVEIPSVTMMSAFRHEDALLSASISSAREQGAAAYVVLDVHETRHPAFYARNELAQLETIVTYEMADPQTFLNSMAQYRLEFLRLTRQTAALGQAVLELDHAAFPWLWWNSAEEFSSYLTMPHIEVWAGVLDGEVISYVGLTHFWRWSHLDRIAIRPDVQRQGYGRETLHFAVKCMVARRAHRIGLSTQGNNVASRRMYESAGFRETPEHHYGVYGIVFEAEGD